VICWMEGVFLIGDKEWLFALDLSNPEGILVLEGRGGLFHRTIEGGSRVARLFTIVGEMISAAEITIIDIGLIGVGRGPGSFTGVRAGVVAAKVLASALGTPLIAPDSLEVLAMGAEGATEAVMVALDARRGELYYGLYRLEEGYPVVLEGPSIAEPGVAVGSLLEWRKKLPTGIGLMGTGIKAYPEVWPSDFEIILGDSPLPQGLADLCRRMAGRGENVDPLELLPLYLRRHDARESFSCGKEGKG
jgi:tRNA threonylcarbamoyladenosine biosynthesis protein TsaB